MTARRRRAARFRIALVTVASLLPFALIALGASHAVRDAFGLPCVITAMSSQTILRR